ncbi:hypothetical protein BJV78DRAFT_1156596 [Lactifluus subvellereus]|nr:hypothetical protein BJV78DRAFT_1156596 [Lactifluus subvellereus]
MYSLGRLGRLLQALPALALKARNLAARADREPAKRYAGLGDGLAVKHAVSHLNLPRPLSMTNVGTPYASASEAPFKVDDYCSGRTFVKDSDVGVPREVQKSVRIAHAWNHLDRP